MEDLSLRHDAKRWLVVLEDSNHVLACDPSNYCIITACKLHSRSKSQMSASDRRVVGNKSICISVDLISSHTLSIQKSFGHAKSTIFLNLAVTSAHSQAHTAPLAWRWAPLSPSGLFHRFHQLFLPPAISHICIASAKNHCDPPT